jgi:hypothetical protein
LEELGYKKVVDDEVILVYCKEEKKIVFYKVFKMIQYTGLRGSMFTMQDIEELKAVYEVCKNLGWLDE